MKHIIFGGFDYAVRYEMDQDAIFRGIDYFVDNDPKLIGTTYLGKEIKHPDVLLYENKDDILILIGSIVYRAELTFQLKEMGYEENKHFVWAIGFCGDEKCPRLWKYAEWKDKSSNAASLDAIENSEYVLSSLKYAVKLIDFNKCNTLIDLGAANERVRPFLPENVRYIPVDYIRYSDETILCDFNKHEFPSPSNNHYAPETTCILSMSCIQYCRDWHWYLKNISQNCKCLILGKQDFARMTREYRKTSWTYNHAVFNHEYILYMLKLNFELVDAMDFRLRREIYKFEKRKGPLQ